MRVLVIETAFPGDAILSVVLADELKRLEPLADIAYLVRPDAKDLLTFAPAIDSVISFDKRKTESGLAGIRSKAKELNDLGFDTIYVLHESERTSKLLNLLNAPMKIGFAGAPDSMKLDRRVEAIAGSRMSRCLGLLSTQYEKVSLETLPTLLIPIHYAEKLGIPLDGSVVLAPGSVWATKSWPATKYRDLAGMLVERGRKVILLGSEKEIEKGQTIAAGLPNGMIHDLTGKTSLVEAAAIIARATGVVANDSAPVHIATAVGTPCVDIYGPTLPSFGYGPGPLGRVVQVESLWCRPCASHGSTTCPVHTHECMESISPVVVLESLLEIEKMSSKLQRE